MDYLDTYLRKNLLDFIHINKREAIKNQKIAVIGGGPAGMTIAEELWQRGYDVTIFEGKDRLGGTLRYVIPEFRFPSTVLDEIEQLLRRIGINIRPNTIIGLGLIIDHLFRDDYEAVFIGTGTWRPIILNIKGESLPHVHFALDYLKKPGAFNLGKKVVVIGGGNTAIDTARTVARMNPGSEVIVMYRRSRKEMPARPPEIKAAEADGIQFRFLSAPIEIREKDIKLIEMQLSDPDHTGRRKPLPIPDSEFFHPADSVLVAIGQRPLPLLAATTPGLEISKDGLLIVDKEGHTTRPGVFGCGDVVLGAATVVQAVQGARKTAVAMDKYLQERIRGEHVS